MASIAAEHHVQRGQRLLDACEWEAAEREFSLAIWHSRGSPTVQMLTGRAVALMRCQGSWEEKVDALMEANAGKCESPQFWALSVRGYVEILDRLDGRGIDLPGPALKRITDTRQAVADSISQGARTFQSYVEAGDKCAWPWAAALVAIGDWLYAFQGVEQGKFGRYPYRPIAEFLYRPVASSDLASLFDDTDTRAEIERQVIHRARLQMTKFAHVPQQAEKQALNRQHLGLSLFALRSP